MGWKTCACSSPSEDDDADLDSGGFPLGTSGVGSIIELGSDVSDWNIGDRVISFLDVSETNTIIAQRQDYWAGPPLWLDGCLWHLGDIDPLLALCFEPAFVSFHCIRESNLRFADTVAVIGLGAIGLLAVRMAALSGAEQIFAVDPLPKRRELALDYGAHHVLDPFDVDAALEIHKLSGGPGVDVAIELSATYPGLQTAIRATRVEGTVCASGVYQGEGRDLWLGREFHRNRLTMIVPHGCFLGHKPRDHSRWDEYRAYDAIISMMRQGVLTAPGLIQPLVSLDEGPAVWDPGCQQASGSGKVWHTLLSGQINGEGGLEWYAQDYPVSRCICRMPWAIHGMNWMPVAKASPGHFGRRLRSI